MMAGMRVGGESLCVVRRSVGVYGVDADEASHTALES